MPEISNIGVLAAFLAGMISFLSPCVLPLVPGYLSYVAGVSVEELRPDAPARARMPAAGLGLCFVLGFSTVFVMLGAGAGFFGGALLAWRYELNIVAGVVVMVFGLFMLGVIRATWLYRDLRFRLPSGGAKPLVAYVIGLAFAFGWTPCIGPVLGAILTVSAVSADAAGGVVLLTVYSLGLGVPFLLAATFTRGLLNRLGALSRTGVALQRVAGVVMILMGAAMVSGQLSRFSWWLLEAFPVLGRIG